MAPSKIREAIGALKDHTTISLAKVGGKTAVSNLQIAIVKASRHEENPPDQRYVTEILSLTSYSRTLVNACVTIIAVRLSKTRNWVVALKLLVLVQRLILQEGQAFEKEIFFASRKGMKFLNLRDFRDSSSKSNAWDYSAFVRTYALYLDEQLEFRMQGYRGRGAGFMLHREEEREGSRGGSAVSNAAVVKATPVSEMKTVAVFNRVQLLMLLLDRFLACRPTGAAKHNRVVVVALCPIVKESFQMFTNVTEVLGVLIDRFMQLDIPDMVKVHDIFCRISKQFDELDSFYEWCKSVGIMRFSEFPDVKQIPQAKLDMMDDFIRQKAAMLQSSRMRGGTPEQKPAPVEQMRKTEPEKALPQPERSIELTKNTEEKKDEKVKVQEEGNLLDLNEDAPEAGEQADKIALALFDGYMPSTAPASTTKPWDTFKDSSVDWEMALVQSDSHLSNQKPSLPKGFDTFTLESMYQQAAMSQVMASSGLMANGSASSVAGRQNMLALPAPPMATGGPNSFADPFAASLTIAPPRYMQMTDIEKKHRLLVEEQQMWQHYAREGMQGQAGMTKVQYPNAYQYVPGGYVQTW